MGFIIPISYDTYHYLTSKSIMTQRIDCADGSVEFEYFNFDTSYSWNYRVKWKLSDEKFVYDPGLKKTMLESGFPHLRIEFSAPKIMLGNNIQTITKDRADVAVHTVWKEFEKTFNVKLPSPEHWFLNRLDVCSNFILPSEKMVKELINYFQMLTYSRKERQTFGVTGIYFPSRHATLKVYHKGPEFKKHDIKRFVDQFEGRRLLNIANSIIRVEGELKNRLRYINDEYLAICKPNRRIQERVWNGYLLYYTTMDLIDFKEELKRMLNILLITKENRIMKAKDVHDKLRQNFTPLQAEVFNSIYTVILTQGLKNAREIYSQNKMARALRAYRFLGISFINPDRSVIEAGLNIPHDFSFEMSENNKYYQLPLAA